METSDAHRPPGSAGRGDRHLPRVRRELHRLLYRTAQTFEDSALRLPLSTFRELAAVLVDFGEDVHCDVGLWHALENHNWKVFGCPLPLAAEPGEPLGTDGPSPQRLRHLIWVTISQLRPDILLKPTHRDLCLLAEVTSSFLNRGFAGIPRDSGVKRFLERTDTSKHG